MAVKPMHVIAVLIFLAAPAADANKPLSPKERHVFDGAACEAFRTALADATKGQEPEAIDEAISTLKRPDAVPESDWQTCVALANRDRAATKVRLIESEAVRMLGQLGDGMAAAYAQTHKLCPSTTPAPVSPALLRGGVYGTKAGDFDDTWECVGKPLVNAQRFQYEIKVDQKKRVFTIFARGYPAGDGKLRTLSRTGRVSGDAVQLDAVQRK